VSPVSVWEIGLKYRLSKWNDAGEIIARVDELMRLSRFSELPLTLAHARAASELDAVHKDPFDRMLIAQAKCENLPIVTGDAIFPRYEVDVVWAAADATL
jgi:PIN domain nuclease of toxin-antitoxin system